VACDMGGTHLTLSQCRVYGLLADSDQEVAESKLRQGPFAREGQV
jgi:hypothetical protein